MTKLPPFACLAAFALLAGCGEKEASPVNIVTTNADAGNAEIVVPAAADNAAGNDAVADEADAAAAPAVNLAPDGLSLVSDSGSARHVTFGMARDAAVTAITTALGKPAKTGHNDDCGQGPMDSVAFKDGLSLAFQDGKFVGWDLDGRDKPAYTTAAGIGIGSTLKALRAAMTVTLEESSLGHEFAAGDLGGLLGGTTPDSRIEYLWAGSVCQFR